MGQLWGTDSLGGYAYSDKLSKELRTTVEPACKLRQFCDAKDATALSGKGKGTLFTWNVYSDLSTEGTTISETTVMPTSSFTISQGTLTMDEWGIGVDYSGKLDDLSEQPIKEIIHKVLKNDCKKALDKGAAAQFDATPLRVVASSGTDTSAVTLTTNGTATTTNNVALGKEHVRTIITTMKERNIPPYDMDDYMAVGWPSVFDTLTSNLESVRQYVETGYTQIMYGEIGRYHGCRFIEQTNVAKANIGTATTAWTNSKSSWVLFFGEDTVAEGIAIPEEIRGKIPGDYGRSKGIAWYALLGFGLIHTQAAQARILMWDSAA